MQNTIKQPNLPIRGIEQKEWQVNGIEQTLNKITKDNFPKLKKKYIPVQIQETHRTPTRQELKRNIQHVMVKTLYRTKEIYQKLQEKMDKSHTKENPPE